MANTVPVTIDLLAKDKASGAIHAVGDSVNHLHARTVAIGAAMGTILGEGIGKLVEFGKASVEAYAESEKSQARLEDAYKRFPAIADVPIESVRKLSEELQRKTGADHNAIVSGDAVLAQFNLTGKQIEGLTPLLVDYATKTGRDIPTAATSLGRAFLGNTRALKELGINYKSTHDQAQDVANITDLLRQKVGGFAEREGKTAAGQAKILGADFNDLKEKIGSALLPVLTRLAGFLINDVVPAMSAMADFVKRNREWLEPLAIAIGVVATALAVYIGTVRTVKEVTEAWTAVQKVLNGELAANPIGLVVVVLAALAVGLYEAYQHSETFRNIVNGAFRGVADAASAMWDVIRPVFKFIIGTWLDVVGGIVDGAAAAFGWVPGIGGKLKSAAKHFDEFRDSVNAALSGIQDKKINVDIVTHGTVRSVNPDGSVTVTAQPGRHFATGGLVTGGVPGRDSVPALLTPGEFVVTPDKSNLIVSSRGSGGDTYNVTVNAGMGADGQSIARDVQQALLKLKRTTGVALGLS